MYNIQYVQSFGVFEDNKREEMFPSYAMEMNAFNQRMRDLNLCPVVMNVDNTEETDEDDDL